MRTGCAAWAAAAVALSAACGARAEAVRNGNDFALEWQAADAKARPALASAHTNLLHTFRFLRIESVAGPDDKGSMTVSTAEPSSDIPVVLVTDGRQSVELARTLQPGETVAARGRLIGLRGAKGDAFLVRPALLQFKDRVSPKAGKELLKEVDRTAR
jgi:hypothetical protein